MADERTRERLWEMRIAKVVQRISEMEYGEVVVTVHQGMPTDIKRIERERFPAEPSTASNHCTDPNREGAS